MNLKLFVVYMHFTFTAALYHLFGWLCVVLALICARPPPLSKFNVYGPTECWFSASEYVTWFHVIVIQQLCVCFCVTFGHRKLSEPIQMNCVSHVFKWNAIWWGEILVMRPHNGFNTHIPVSEKCMGSGWLFMPRAHFYGLYVYCVYNIV